MTSLVQLGRTLVVSMLLLAGAVLASGQTTFYWDLNGATAGAGGATPTGTWNTATANWTTNTLGTAATTTYTSGGNAVFSAGSDATGAYTVTISGTQNVNNITVEEGSPTLSGGTLNFSAAGGTLNIAAGSTLTTTGILAGTATFNKNGTGTFVTGGTGTNTQSGAVNVNAGVFEIAKSGFVGAINNTSAVTVASGATLRFNGDSAYTQETMGSLAGAGTVTNAGAAAVNVITGGDNTSTTFSGTITNTTNAINLQKSGTGTMTLSGANSYTGTTTVNTGILNIQNATALGTTAGGTTVATGATLQVQGGISVGNEALTLSGAGAAGQTGALVNVSGTNNYGGLVTLGAATTISSDSGTLNLTNAGTITGPTFGLTLAGAGNGSLASAIGTTTGSLTKNGTGAWSVSGASTYSGTTTINAGKLQLGASNALPSGTAVTIASGATFDVNSLTQTVGSIAGAGSITLGTGSLTAGGNNTSTTFGGSLTGTGTFTKAGTGTLSLSSSISFGGTMVLSSGTLQLSGTTLTLGTLNITGNSVIDFAGASASLNVTNLFIQAGSTLSIINWQDGVDSFTASNWSGATYYTAGSNPMNQITFNGYSANSTRWQSYDNQITPVPEPSTYGAGLLGATMMLGCFYKLRSRKK
jgi:fibronectin-binding autotransporter adhesin